MKLLFFIHSLSGGGAERVLVNITSGLAERGHDVTVVVNREEYAYEVNPKVKILPAPHLDSKGKENAIHRIIRNLKNLRSFHTHTGNAIRKVQPDAIISFLFCNIPSILRYHAHIPIVHSEHNTYDRRLSMDHMFKRFYLNRLFDKVFVLTSYDQGYAKAKGIKNSVVMPNPNTFSSISLEKYEDLFPYRRNVLLCGRLNQWEIKGFDIGIEAFAKIADKYSDVDLDFAGEGSEKNIKYLQTLAQSMGVGHRVHFLGRRNDIKDVMRAHQVFLLSSRTEGFPMVITEAMTQGMPCVTFEKLASSIIVNKIDGILVKDRDANSLAEAMDSLLANEQLRHTLGKNAIENVSRFSTAEVSEMWERELFNLTGKK